MQNSCRWQKSILLGSGFARRQARDVAAASVTSPSSCSSFGTYCVVGVDISRRGVSSSSASASSASSKATEQQQKKPVVRGPTPASKSWERGAKMVKNTSVQNQYLDAIRETHDPSFHIKTIEDELKETIGKALGRQGEKILNALKLMDDEYRKYEDLLHKHHHDNDAVTESVKAYNQYRSEAIKARWELIVHRQAVGFIVNNHRYVMESYPIPDALPVGENDGNGNDLGKAKTSASKSKSSSSRESVDGQLDWWQRIGRWR